MKPLIWIVPSVCAAVLSVIPFSLWPSSKPDLKSVSVIPTTMPRSEKPGPDHFGVVGVNTHAELDRKIARLKAWLDGSGPKLDTGQVADILKGWSAVSPEEALTFVSTAPRFPRRYAALAIPLTAIAKGRMPVVIAWLQANLSEDERGVVAAQILTAIETTDPRSALALAFAKGIPVDNPHFQKAIVALAGENVPEALTAFARLSEEGQVSVVGDLVETWARLDLKGAVTWCNATKAGYCQDSAQAALLTAVEKTRPLELAQLIKDLAPSRAGFNQWIWRRQGEERVIPKELLPLLPQELREPRVIHLARDEIEDSPANALMMIKQLVTPEHQTGALRMALQQWVNSDRPAALAWIAAQSDPVVVRTRDDMAMDALGAEERLAILDRAPDDAASRRSKRYALGRLADKKPEVAAEWVMRNAAGAEPDSVRRVTGQFFSKDEAAAAQWLATLPQGETRDVALSVAASRWSRQGDVDFAVEAIRAIGNQDEKVSATFAIFSDAYRQDRAKALHWAEQQGYSAETTSTWEVLAKKIQAVGSIN